MKQKKNIIFGLGPGRCGSSSLSWLLNEQEDTLATHELFPILPWDTSNNSLAQYKWEQLHHQTHLWKNVADVGSYYIQWVPFLMKSYNAVSYLQENFNFKFIVLKRPVEGVVTSYLAKFKKNNNNPLQNHGDPKLTTNEWDASYPKYDDVSLEEAIRLYCTDYYVRAEQLQSEYPENVRVFDWECLNTASGVSSILNFAGVEDKQRVLMEIKKNQGT